MAITKTIRQWLYGRACLIWAHVAALRYMHRGWCIYTEHQGWQLTLVALTSGTARNRTLKVERIFYGQPNPIFNYFHHEHTNG